MTALSPWWGLFHQSGAGARNVSSTIVARVALNRTSFLISSRCPPRLAPLKTFTTTGSQKVLRPTQTEVLCVNSKRSRFPTPVHSTRTGFCRRHCSSEASSSLVKMASDRDVLSDEYVMTFILWTIEFLTQEQRQAFKLLNLPLRPQIRRTMDLPRPM